MLLERYRALARLRTVRALVVGDVMLDRYCHGDVPRISPEAPVPIVHVARFESRLGGAGNVARNMASLGVQVTLIGLLGDDEHADCCEHLLNAAGVEHIMVRIAKKPTISKLRVVGCNQQLLRLDFEQRFDEADARSVEAKFLARLEQVDVVVLSDYDKGCLYDPQYFISRARAAGKQVIVDPKSSDFSRYQGATCLTPNLREFELALGHCAGQASLSQRAMQCINDHDFAAMLVTQGQAGMTLFCSDQLDLQLAANAREVYDVTGAGDTVVAVLAAAMGADFPLAFAARLANDAAGLVVGKLGTASVEVDELLQFDELTVGRSRGVISDSAFMPLRACLRAQNKRLVFTNGCFDILHAGHVNYLAEARALGDYLVVGLNDDASITQLKGPMRPINPLDNRAAVLAALDAVDWVVPFSESTPERLINQLLPDVLVKGADYAIHEIAGHQAVLAHGGDVKTLPLVPNCSTSDIINKIHDKTNLQMEIES